jgi:P27 family predicted phage terminase small subunit
VVLKLLSGNPGKRSAAAAKLRIFAEGVPVCPTWLNKEGKAEWKRVMSELKASGIMSVVDRAALAAYCQAWSDMVAAAKTLAEEGSIIEQPIQNAKGELIGEKKVPHPALKMQREATHRVKSFLCEFGFSPASRRRMGDGPAAGQAAVAKPGNRLDEIRERREQANG